MLHLTGTTQTIKKAVPARQRQNKEEKNQHNQGMEMEG